MFSRKDKEIFKYTSIISQLFIPLCGVIFHLLLLYAFARDPVKCFRNLGMVLVINLAIADFLACCTMLLYYFIQMLDSTGGRLLFEFFGRSFAQISCFTIASLSIDRLVLVLYPIKHRCWIKKKVLTVWLSCLWILSVSYASKRFIFGVEQNYEKLLYEILAATLFFLTSFAYVLVCITMRKKIKNRAVLNELGNSHHSEQLRLHKEKNFLKTVILIASVTFISYIPVWIMIKVFGSNALAKTICTVILNLLFSINFAINPLIYILRFRNYRKTFKIFYF